MDDSVTKTNKRRYNCTVGGYVATYECGNQEISSDPMQTVWMRRNMLVLKSIV